MYRSVSGDDRVVKLHPSLRVAWTYLVLTASFIKRRPGKKCCPVKSPGARPCCFLASQRPTAGDKKAREDCLDKS